jgi:RNA polymerase sigma factor (sigma-70 family)
VSDGSVNHLVDHLFRRKYGQMIAILTRIFGLENWELAEDVVQDTLLQALKQWSYSGVPENPGGWLTQVAKHRAIDVLRRQKNFRNKIAQFEIEESLADDDLFGDDQLTMLFLGCHPLLSREMQITLLLKTLCGFSVGEIARAFLLPEATIAQRIVRAKRKIKPLSFELPPENELYTRLDGVLVVLYLLFNEGYNASSGDQLTRAELCAEAIYLCNLLVNHPLGQQPRIHALLALMYLQVSRLPARTSTEGDLLRLAEQDRAKWDPAAIRRGIAHLEQAAQGDEVTEYHLLAGIAACHTLAPGDAETDWSSVLFYYDQLIALNRSPVTVLNRAVGVAMVHGAEAGLAALDAITDLDEYYLLMATYGELYERSGKLDCAVDAYRRALALTTNLAEQNFLRKKIAQASFAER